MKNWITVFLLSGAASVFAQSKYKPAQRYWELGFLWGLTNYSGDLTDQPIQLAETGIGYGAQARCQLSPKFALRASMFYGAISGDDAHAKDPEVRQRSLRFGTDILELGLCGEWHMWGKPRFSSLGEHHFSLSPYAYLGLGAAFCGPKTEYYGAPEDRDKFIRAPLPETAARQQFLLAPMGMGIRADLNEGLTIGLEGGWRPVFSDNLDGVRLNGNPASNDWYYFGGVSLAFVLGSSQKG